MAILHVPGFLSSQKPACVMKLLLFDTAMHAQRTSQALALVITYALPMCCAPAGRDPRATAAVCRGRCNRGAAERRGPLRVWQVRVACCAVLWLQQWAGALSLLPCLTN
jgi:hypothetical protein